MQRIWHSTTGRHMTAKKPKIVILGCGWGGFRLARVIDKKKFSVVLISPRNHFVFTPLLPSTAVGTLEFRCVQVMCIINIYCTSYIICNCL